MDTLRNYIEQHQDRILEELFQALKIPSISSNPESAPAMQATAEYFKNALLEAGASRAEVMATKGWPVVFGEHLVDPDLPTVLVYGHYDVQPPEPLEEWVSPAFEPEIRDGKIYGRGADDDKGQLFMQLKAFEFMMAENKVPCNIKFLIEGEEEIGSPSLKEFCMQHKEMLKADVVLVSDTTLLSLEQPTLTTGLRGLAYFELHIQGPNRDLHSGLYGGAVNNPANELATLISKLKNEQGRILIPGFYDSVLDISNEEHRLLKQLPFNEASFAAGIGVGQLAGEDGYSTTERLGVRPSLDVNGIWGGFTEGGAKTILPAKASAKISMRLVPNQSPDEIETLFRDYLKQIAPKSVSWELHALHGGNPYLSPWEAKGTQAAVKAMEQVLGKAPLPVRSGGSIPVIADFEEVLGCKAVLMGFGLDTDAIHSPNENFPLENFWKGIETIPWFYHYFTSK